MKLTTRQDIEAPIDVVFAAVTDFEGFERQGLRRGAEVSRQDPDDGPGLGSRWTIKAAFRGKPRDFVAAITRFDPPNGFHVNSRTGGVEGDIIADLVALSPRRTRLQIGIELRPTSLGGRLLVQSLKFARGTLNSRLRNRAGQFAQSVEDRHRGI